MRLAVLIALALLALASGCPSGKGVASGDGLHAGAAQFNPAQPIPARADNPLAAYGKLHLGMSSTELAAAYPAPDGKGQGFTRTIEDFGDVQNHIITFDAAKGQPARRIIVQLYRDQAEKLVERRDGLSEAQAKKWLGELKAAYGEPAKETVPGAQWSWGDAASIQLTYTQDNASPADMSANVVLEHKPTHDAALYYMGEWEKTHK